MSQLKVFQLHVVPVVNGMKHKSLLKVTKGPSQISNVEATYRVLHDLRIQEKLSRGNPLNTIIIVSEETGKYR